MLSVPSTRPAASIPRACRIRSITSRVRAPSSVACSTSCARAARSSSARCTRDRQSATQMTHVALHHWCAEVDRFQGVVHRPTYTRRQLIRLIEQLDLNDVRSSEINDTSSDPKDAATIQAVDGAIERYLRKAEVHPEAVRSGEEIRRRLRTIGIHGAATLVVVGLEAAIVKLYAGTTEQFRADAQMHRIAEKLRAEYIAQIGHKPAPPRLRAGRTASWRCRCSSTRPS